MTAINKHRTSSEYDWLPHGQNGVLLQMLAGPSEASHDINPARRIHADALSVTETFIKMGYQK